MGEGFTIHQLPPELLIEIFAYLPYFDRQQASRVCKSWRKIGQQTLFTTRECLKFIHCGDIAADRAPGNFVAATDRKFLNLRICKGVNVTPTSMEVIRKVAQDVQELELQGNLAWDIDLITFLRAFPVLRRVEIGAFLEQQVNSRDFVEFVAESSIQEVALHGVKDDFFHYFTNSLKKVSGKTVSLFFPYNSEHRDKFDRFIDRISGNSGLKLLELTVPFKLKALQALAKLSLNISELRKLEITSPKSFEELKHVCQRMPCLKELVLWRGCLDFQLFDVFDYLVNLETLRIQSGIRLTQGSSFCENLHPKPHMRTFEVELIEGSIDLGGFSRLLRCLSNLTSLSLSQSEIEDDHLCVICEQLRNLRVLKIDFGHITSKGMQLARWENLRRLEKLQISGCHKVTDEAFVDFPPRLEDLRELRLNYMPQLTSVAIEKVVQQCPNVEYLSLDGCEGIDDAAIKLIAANLRRLRQLDLYCCQRLTKRCVQHFVQHCTNLQFLDLSALNLDEEDKVELHEKLKTIRYIYDYDDGTDLSKYFKGKLLRKRELSATIQL